MFSAAPKKHVSLRLIPVLAGIAALVFLWFSADRIDSGNQAKEKEIISTALSRSITSAMHSKDFILRIWIIFAAIMGLPTIPITFLLIINTSAATCGRMSQL